MVFICKRPLFSIDPLKFRNYKQSFLNDTFRGFCCHKGKTADLAIIGVGPAGQYAALRAVKNGIKNVVVIDKYPNMGGTCINFGCIPTKCLLKFSSSYQMVKSGYFALQGVVTPEPKLDLDQMMRTKTKVMKEVSDHIQKLFKSQKIHVIRGKARISGCNQLSVEGNDGKKSVIEAENVLIATGSVVRPIPGIEIDEKQIITSNGAVKLQEVPKRMFIIGAGIIGVELGSVWSRLGSKVTIVSHDNTIIGTRLDKDIRKRYQKILEEQGLNFMFDTKILCATKCGSIVKFEVSDKDGCNKKELECDVLLLAVGRIPYTEGLQLEKVGIQTDERGFIPVQKNYQTCTPNFYAAGDITPGPMTAHKAIEDGILMVDALCGNKEINFDFNNIPMAIYTHPEAACVGKTEDDLIKEGHPYRVTWSSFESCARAHTDLDTTGCIKALICGNTDRILGTHMIGKNAGELINEVVLAQQYGITAENLSRVVHAHPTYATILKRAF